jgi:hypothetical protein
MDYHAEFQAMFLPKRMGFLSTLPENGSRSQGSQQVEKSPAKRVEGRAEHVE